MEITIHMMTGVLVMIFNYSSTIVMTIQLEKDQNPVRQGIIVKMVA